jgi:cell division protein FtsX
MLEGLLQGLAGAALSSVLLLLGNADWTAGVRKFPTNAGLGGFVVTNGYPVRVVIFMVLLGAFVGAVGSATAASRFLDV